MIGSEEMNEELVKYIEENVFPVYEKNEVAHGITHIKDVIKRSFRLVETNGLDVDKNMVYVIAAYHDIGHHIDAGNHEHVSAEMMMEDEELKKYFNADELNIIHDAIEDHRASSKTDPRTIYGKIVSSADRNESVEQCLKRSYVYGKKLLGDVTDEEVYENAYNVLKSKFGEGGYAKFFFRDAEYEKFLKEIRELMSDKEKFIQTQRDYIKSLKEKGEI